MTKYYAAVDMGASSGRLILGHMENGRMGLEEIHRLTSFFLIKMTRYLVTQSDTATIVQREWMKKFTRSFHLKNCMQEQVSRKLFTIRYIS